MTKMAITSTVKSTVTLDRGNYGSSLTITGTGAILPSTPGAYALIVPSNVANGTIVNKGKIEGALARSSGGAAGIGIDLQSAAVLVNSGHIYGGSGVLPNDPFPGTDGGYGVLLTAAGQVNNAGIIGGGNAGGGNAADNTGPGSGGKGLYASSAGVSLTNSGTIFGGTGGYGAPHGLDGISGWFGGDGVYLRHAGTLANTDTIRGGNGGKGYAYGGQGAVGVNLYGGTLTNAGLIIGGTGGKSPAGPGGNGGAGALLQWFAEGTSTGTLIGGAGGSGVHGGNGGAGLHFFIGDFTATGTFIGGAGGIGSKSNGAQGPAIQFDGAGTLTVDPQATFNGILQGEGNDLDLAGSTAGTLETTFTKFNLVTVLAGSNWTLPEIDKVQAASPSVQCGLFVQGVCSVTGTLSGLQGVQLAATGTLAATGQGAVEFLGAGLYGGTLNDQGARIIIGPSLATSAATQGCITIEKQGAVSGYGVLVGAPIVDNGIVSAGPGGTLTFATSASGSGTLEIAQYGAAAARSTMDVKHVEFAKYGPGTLSLSAASADHFTLTGFTTGDVLDLGGVTATTLTIAAGSLTLLDGGKVADRISITGSYTLSDFSLTQDGHFGTSLSYGTTSEAHPGARHDIGSGGPLAMPISHFEPDAQWLALHPIL